MTTILFKKKNILLLLFVLFLLFLPLFSVFAGEEGDVQLINPLDAQNTSGLDIPTILTGIARVLLSFVGLLAFLMFVWGGFTWLTSAGRSEQVESGKKTLIWAVVGMILAFGSFLLLNLLVTALVGAQ